MIKKINQLMVMILSICLVFLVGCNLLKTYEDTNGESDYTLQSITDSMILKGGTYQEIGSFTTQKNNDISINVNKFNGIKTIEEFRKYKYDIKLSFEVEEGNASLVLCSNDEILHRFTTNEKNQEFSFECNNKVYLKIAGESCKYRLNYTVTKY